LEVAAKSAALYTRSMTFNCGICTIVQQEANLLTTEYWKVNLAPDQGYLGRTYVVLRDHKRSLSELSDAEWKDYAEIVGRLEKAYKKSLRATLFNWSCLMNNAYQTEPYLPHVHWHFRPRYKQPVAINGITFEDPQFGHHYDRDQRRTVDDETFRAILEKIKTHL
jgi:diadenosine tetraphosphate (Ap4A) HIT family hydrolase